MQRAQSSARILAPLSRSAPAEPESIEGIPIQDLATDENVQSRCLVSRRASLGGPIAELAQGIFELQRVLQGYRSTLKFVTEETL